MGKKFGIAAALGAFLFSTNVGAVDIDDVVERIYDEPAIAILTSAHSTDEFIIKVFEQTNVVFIREGMGGNLNGMLQTLAYLDMNPQKLIVIDGDCYSACTLLLSRPNNVVFTENANFLFHSASSTYCRDSKIQTELYLEGNQQMLEILPRKVSKWVSKRKAFASTKFTRMSTFEAIDFLPDMFVHNEDLPDMELTGGSIRTKPTDALGDMIAACK